MKVVVSAIGPTLDDNVDERFGRALHLLLVDSDTFAFAVLDNKQNRDALQGAGIGAAELVADAGAQAVITGHLGPKAFQALSLAGLVGFGGVGMTVRQAVAELAAGRLVPLSEGEAHAGLDL